MTSALISSVKRYCNHSRRLQTILEETKRCFDDINESGKNENGQILSVELLHEEEDEVLSTARKHPGIVVLGQNTFCKAEVVNKLFGRTIFPSFDNSDDRKRYRTVRFRYGENLCINLELPGDYSLAENLEAYNGPWNTIPHKDLHVEDDVPDSSAAGSAVLEVSFNHQLLRHGCTLVVSASNTGFEEELRRCVDGISPIIIYAFHTESLETKEIQDLELLKEMTHFQPVCFVKVPSPGVVGPVVMSGSPFGSAVVSSPNKPLKTTQTGTFVTVLDVNSNNHSKESEKDTVQNCKDLENNCVLNDPNNGSADGGIKRAEQNEGDGNLGKMGGEAQVNNDSSRSSQRHGRVLYSTIPPNSCQHVFNQLCKVGYLSEMPGVRNISRDMVQDYFEVDSIFVTMFDQFVASFTPFCEQTMQRYLVNAVTVLNNTHIRCLNMFIISAFDMAREVLITPKKLEFAREKEQELYKSLFQIAVAKDVEIREMIEKTIKENCNKLVKKVEEYDFIGVDFSDKGEILTHKGLKICTGQIQELVLGGLNQAVAGQLVNSVDILRDSYTGTLTRCLESLEMVEQENPDNHSTTDALKQILNAAYQVEITVRSSSTFIHFLLVRMKQLILTTYRLEIEIDDSSTYTFRRKMRQLVQAMPWSQSPKIDNEWKRKVAEEMLANLSANRLAKSISSQIKDRLNKSHDAFSQALGQLELKHTGRLDKIEEDRLRLRKNYAPRVAKVALESTSLKDLILHGMPQMGKEVGRGQYGVVFSCDTWAGYSPCAVKSVVPPDDKHWNDLALEFFYTKHIPEHDRVVGLKGSVIDYSYGGGSTPAVLLVMTRMQRDLHTAIKQHLDWVSRLQVAIDVVEGIRFLHSQGLVHRDIKLKNVLLDKDNRGKITDLGFCKPEAMMSGSIVGTPIHMAPELFTGRYDNSVDVYAFGILFWYICAGSTRLPQNFEQCANKDQLWNNVKKGLRPEELPIFDKECWALMSYCWEGDSPKRPLLGEVHQKLTQIHDRYKSQPRSQTRDSPNRNTSKQLKPKTKR